MIQLEIAHDIADFSVIIPERLSFPLNTTGMKDKIIGDLARGLAHRLTFLNYGSSPPAAVAISWHLRRFPLIRRNLGINWIN